MLITPPRQADTPRLLPPFATPAADDAADYITLMPCFDDATADYAFSLFSPY